MHPTRQSGTIILWLLLTTAGTSLVLASSWIREGSYWIGKGRTPAQFDQSDVAPKRQMKLLAVEVVTGAARTDVKPGGFADAQSIDVTQQAANTKPAHADHEQSHDPEDTDISSSETANVDDNENTRQGLVAHPIHEAVLDESAGLQFENNSKKVTELMQPSLKRLLAILSEHDDVRVVVAVATNETDNLKNDLRLSQERGRAIIARLVSNGIDFSRVSLDASSGPGIPDNSHVVKVQVWKL